MKYKLDWNKLLCGERERDSEKSFTEHRNEFDKDYDRIVYSSSIRRLQDKAQVFPLQENDFTRTRLTHSIEAAALARSLGAAIGDWLRRNGEFEEKQERELASLLQVAALIHDLGNPPFGHYGEDVIRKWFVEWFKSNEYKNIEKKLRLSENEEKDFINFEGNAQTLRIVTKLQMLNDQFGVNFTYATLATIMKYPWLSSFENSIKKNKFGYFNAEKKVVEKIYKCTGLEDEVRHPATFLLEAADDIAYLCADIEDSVKKGIINWEKEYTKIKYKLMNENKDYSNMFKKLDELNEKNIKNDIPEYELKRIQKHCFVDKEVLTLELVGDKVISGLLDMFVNELVKCKDEPNSKKKSGKLYRLISDNFKYVCLFDYENNRKREFNELRVYDKILLITDFISGMTDSYAVKLYKELTGVKLP